MAFKIKQQHTTADRMEVPGNVKLHRIVVMAMVILGYVLSTQSCYINVLCFLEYESNAHRNTNLAVTISQHGTISHNLL